MLKLHLQTMEKRLNKSRYSELEAPVSQSIFDLLAWREEEIPRVRALLAMRRFWSRDLYRSLQDEYQAALDGGDAPTSADAARPLVDALPSLPRWSWLDRHIQDRLWYTVEGMVGDRGGALSQCMATHENDLGTLTFNTDQVYPAYYEETDFHRQKGGIWRDDRSAAVYAMGARVIHIGKNDNFGLHDAFARDIAAAAPGRILDLACGFGKTTFSLKKKYPDAVVEGIDLAAPCLRLARRMASDWQLEIDWRQGDIENLPYDEAEFDLVTATMTLHELPLDAIARTLAQAHRVLKPGGILVVLENPLVGEPLRDVLTQYHSEIIMEPFHYEFRRADMCDFAFAAGFADAQNSDWFPFGAAAAAAAAGDGRNWVTPWRWTQARKEN
jgi:ubiquinone/menaquinone biosynthesis C-methylase UbiE